MSALHATAQRVFAIGLDMGDGELIRYWSDQGQLPHFASLLSSGTWVDLESTAQVLHTSTWPTFATGTLPGRHGVYFPYQPKPGHQLAQHIQPDQYGVPTFWKMADAQGRSCVVYDVPETFPEAGFQGRAIFDWGTWAWYGRPCACPPSVLKDMKSRFGRYPLGFEAKRLGAKIPDAGVLEKRVLRSIAYKVDTARWLLHQDAWQLAVLGFGEPHPAGHYLWPLEADDVASGDARAFQPLLHVYQALDRALGELLDHLPADTAVMIVSGDGIRPNRCGWYLLPTVLERLGLTCPPASNEGAAPSPSLIGRVKRRVPPRTRRLIADRLPWWLRDQIGAQEQAGNIDWSRTRAFTLPTDLEGCIRINLKGREPEGIVEPGAEYEALCRELRSELEALTNPDTGAAAVRHVWIRNEIFPGERQEHLPDVIVTWNDTAPFTTLSSPRIGRVEGETADLRPGTHSPYGFLLAGGTGVPPGGHSRGHLADVAPTILRLLGLDLPDGLDGTPLRILAPGAESTFQA
jgi:predicted AlkP superfamily phosphohydrolase/phosphomutase